MELEENAVAALDDPLRGRVPVEGRTGRVREDRDVLERPLVPRHSCRRDRATEHDRRERGKKATHVAAL
jgi:hypothetical protein